MDRIGAPVTGLRRHRRPAGHIAAPDHGGLSVEYIVVIALFAVMLVVVGSAMTAGRGDILAFTQARLCDVSGDPGCASEEQPPPGGDTDPVEPDPPLGDADDAEIPETDVASPPGADDEQPALGGSAPEAPVDPVLPAPEGPPVPEMDDAEPHDEDGAESLDTEVDPPPAVDEQESPGGGAPGSLADVVVPIPGASVPSMLVEYAVDSEREADDFWHAVPLNHDVQLAAAADGSQGSVSVGTIVDDDGAVLLTQVIPRLGPNGCASGTECQTAPTNKLVETGVGIPQEDGTYRLLVKQSHVVPADSFRVYREAFARADEVTGVAREDPFAVARATLIEAMANASGLTYDELSGSFSDDDRVHLMTEAIVIDYVVRGGEILFRNEVNELVPLQGNVVNAGVTVHATTAGQALGITTTPGLREPIRVGSGEGTFVLNSYLTQTQSIESPGISGWTFGVSAPGGAGINIGNTTTAGGESWFAGERPVFGTDLIVNPAAGIVQMQDGGNVDSEPATGLLQVIDITPDKSLQKQIDKAEEEGGTLSGEGAKLEEWDDAWDLTGVNVGYALENDWDLSGVTFGQIADTGMSFSDLSSRALADAGIDLSGTGFAELTGAGVSLADETFGSLVHSRGVDVGGVRAGDLAAAIGGLDTDFPLADDFLDFTGYTLPEIHGFGISTRGTTFDALADRGVDFSDSTWDQVALNVIDTTGEGTLDFNALANAGIPLDGADIFALADANVATSETPLTTLYDAGVNWEGSRAADIAALVAAPESAEERMPLDQFMARGGVISGEELYDIDDLFAPATVTPQEFADAGGLASGVDAATFLDQLADGSINAETLHHLGVTFDMHVADAHALGIGTHNITFPNANAIGISFTGLPIDHVIPIVEGDQLGVTIAEAFGAGLVIDEELRYELGEDPLTALAQNHGVYAPGTPLTTLTEHFDLRHDRLYVTDEYGTVTEISVLPEDVDDVTLGDGEVGLYVPEGTDPISSALPAGGLTVWDSNGVDLSDTSLPDIGVTIPVYDPILYDPPYIPGDGDRFGPIDNSDPPWGSDPDDESTMPDIPPIEWERPGSFTDGDDYGFGDVTLPEYDGGGFDNSFIENPIFSDPYTGSDPLGDL